MAQPKAEATSAESLMLVALTAIARGKPNCNGCPWDEPCDKCFASSIVGSVIHTPQFSTWRKCYKITAKRRKKKKGGAS